MFSCFPLVKFSVLHCFSYFPVLFNEVSVLSHFFSAYFGFVGKSVSSPLAWCHHILMYATFPMNIVIKRMHVVKADRAIASLYVYELYYHIISKAKPNKTNKTIKKHTHTHTSRSFTSWLQWSPFCII